MNKILELLEKDQENIKLFKSGKITLSEMRAVNLIIKQKFLEIVKNDGFPYKNKVDSEIYKAGITLALHFPPDELEKIFKDLEKLTEVEFDLSDKAYFVDRLKVLKNEKQIYGTQFNKDENGHISFFPIENVGNVDERRLQMGLCTLVEYINFINGKRNSVKK